MGGDNDHEDDGSGGLLAASRKADGWIWQPSSKSGRRAGRTAADGSLAGGGCGLSSHLSLASHGATAQWAGSHVELVATI
ncbi:hypothetical protein E2562_035556 [Oryza meyeriana var. granulata]|uniref:Uncharacterized protein n=1 Tax=Oryza meyeriana var. granulata TaxID=110450 RepID=A0A6G1DS83_9ORYZ|nr:hypothetical protein E2562_035556 [Oryza meyeriana var. granulata]